MDLNWTSSIWDALADAEFRPDGGEDANTFQGKQSVPTEIVAALTELKEKIQGIADTQ